VNSDEKLKKIELYMSSNSKAHAVKVEAVAVQYLLNSRPYSTDVLVGCPFGVCRWW